MNNYMSQPPKRPFKPSFNVQMYNVIDRVDLSIRETHPTREVIDLYEESVNYYGGITFLLDNITKVIYTWVSNYAKKRDWAKKIGGEKNPTKLERMVLEILEKELGITFAGYKVKREEEGNHSNEFETMFLYEVQEFDLYKQHYYRSDVEALMPQEDIYSPKVEETILKCKKCGWILSKGKTKCPKCQTPVPDESTPEGFVPDFVKKE